MVKRIEHGIDAAASALLAASIGYAASAWLLVEVPAPFRQAESCVGAIAAFLIGYRVLGAVQPPSERLAVPIFDVREIEHLPPQRLDEEPLLLDDILAELEPDSRVVRLFDPAAMPSPAELKDRIDRHLDLPPADASDALHQALADLRRSLR